MELRAAREMRRNEQLTKAGIKGDRPGTPAQAGPSRRQTADRCTLSRQALAYLEQQNALARELDERRARQQSKFAECENKKGELDLLSKAMDVMDACMKIAASIMRGDKVPMKDLKYLMENDPVGYKLAMALRREKEDPEKVKSVLDDQEQPAPTEGDGARGEVPAPGE